MSFNEDYEKVSDNNTDGLTLQNIIEKENVELTIISMIVKHPNVNSETLNVLRLHKNFTIRQFVAKHKNCSIKTLKFLAFDSERTVVYRVAENENTDEDTLIHLSRRKDRNMLQAVLKNPSCPIFILREFWETIELKYVIICNVNCPMDIVESFWTTCKNDSWILPILTNILHKENCPEYILKEALEIKNLEVTAVNILSNKKGLTSFK